MSKLKCWFAGSSWPEDFAWVDAVFANSYREAKKTVWAKGTNIVDECDAEYTDLRLTRAKEHDHLAVGNEPYVADDSKVLREMGWGYEGDSRCSACGGATLEGEFPLCDECECCAECGHDEDCSEGASHD